jgi:predicted GNAT superfamily acetyltransferase
MEETIVRECTTIAEFDRCIDLQREAFGLPDLEISPRRHLIVSRQAGGWTLGAFVSDRMVGFVHHLAAVRSDNEIFGLFTYDGSRKGLPEQRCRCAT